MNQLKVVYNFITLVLLCTNLIYLIIDYMKYKSDTNVAPYFPVTLEVPKISLCFSLFSIMGSIHLKKYSFSFMFPPFLNKTFNQVLEKAPLTSKVLSSCKYRDFNKSILIEEKNRTKCSTIFNITRFKMQGYICYKFQFTLFSEYSFHALVNSLYEPRELYHLNLNSIFSEEYIFFPLIHFDDLPDDDRVFNQEAYVDTNTNHHLSYDLYETTSLPPPYETNCADDSKVNCFQQCIDRLYKKYGVISDGSIVKENSSEASLTAVVDVDGININTHRRSCYKKCPYEACNYKMVNTRIYQPNKSPNELTAVVETVNRPITKIQYVPRIYLFDFITQFANVICIWTGISFITLVKIVSLNTNLNTKLIRNKIRYYSSTVHKIILLKYRSSNRPNQVKRTYKKKNHRRVSVFLIKLLIKLLVLGLFCWQISNLMREYLTYKTTIKLNYDMNPEIKMPTLTSCLPLKDVFRLKFPDDVTEENFNQYFLNKDSKLNYTFEQIFNHLNSSDLITGCLMRKWNHPLRILMHHNYTRCLNHFKIKKFFYQQKLCFLTVPNLRNETYYQSEVRFLTSYPGFIYGLYIDSKLSRKLFISTHFTSNIPYDSIQYMTKINSKKSKNMLLLSNQHYQTKFLEPPYDTSCSLKYGSNVCFKKCEHNLLKRINKIPYSSFEEQNSSMKILSYTDLLNETINRILKKTENKCKEKCKHSFCNLDFTLTFLEGQTSALIERKGEILLIIGVNSYPKSEIIAHPMTQLYDLIYQIFCCFSFWFGFSVLNTIEFKKDDKEQKVAITLLRRFIRLKNILNIILDEKSVNNLSMNLRSKCKPISLVILLIATISCCFHLVISMKIYLNYPSILDIYQRFESEKDIDLYICLDASELISSKKKISIDSIITKSKVLNRTISSIFDETPKEDEIIEKCTHWGLSERRGKISNMSKISDRIMFTYQNKSICHQLYKVKKFFFNNYMCYGILDKYYSHWDKFQMKKTLHYQDTYFKIYINSSTLTNRFSLLVSTEMGPPKSSSNWASNLFKDPNITSYEVSFLQYHQNIFNKEYSNPNFPPFVFDKCLRKCFSYNLKQFNSTISDRFEKGVNSRLITYLDRQGNFVGKYTNEMLKKCESKCHKHNKYIGNGHRTNNFVPIVKNLREKDEKAKTFTSFRLKTTDNPATIIKLRRQITFFEQLINIGSIISIWFGFSMIQLSRFNGRKIKINQDELFIMDEKMRKLKLMYKINN